MKAHTIAGDGARSHAGNNGRNCLASVSPSKPTLKWRNPINLLPKHTRDIPTDVGCQAQCEHEPPEHKDGTHP
jgi:hypothetical protein